MTPGGHVCNDWSVKQQKKKTWDVGGDWGRWMALGQFRLLMNTMIRSLTWTSWFLDLDLTRPEPSGITDRCILSSVQRTCSESGVWLILNQQIVLPAPVLLNAEGFYSEKLIVLCVADISSILALVLALACVYVCVSHVAAQWPVCRREQTHMYYLVTWPAAERYWHIYREREAGSLWSCVCLQIWRVKMKRTTRRDDPSVFMCLCRLDIVNRTNRTRENLTRVQTGNSDRKCWPLLWSGFIWTGLIFNSQNNKNRSSRKNIYRAQGVYRVYR